MRKRERERGKMRKRIRSLLLEEPDSRHDVK